jgi:hypothetical protein
MLSAKHEGQMDRSGTWLFVGAFLALTGEAVGLGRTIVFFGAMALGWAVNGWERRKDA